uniref:hypothetical protein n=1 Tax=Halobacterium sp. (strain GN101) TaxID=88773 RepID=UPI002100163C|nr:hypothetical protein [Halobacterium sp. GN101]
MAVGLAGCSRLSGTAPAADGPDQSENTASDPPEISISISTEAEPAQLPSVWTDSKSIEEFQAQFSVETSGQPTQAAVSNGNVEISQDSEQWNGTSVTVQPGQMLNGNQEFKATAQKNNAKAEDTTQTTKKTPGNYKLDIVPEKNEELRKTIQENADEDNYLKDRGEFIKEDPVFNSYNSHQNLEFDKLGVDLTALEWRHDNDYETLESDYQDSEAKNLVDSIGTDTGNPEIERVKNNPILRPYPNSSGGRDPGQWDYEQFSSSTTLGEALDWLHPYLFNWQQMMTEGPAISSEDFIYAPTLEQSIEQHTNIEAHAWDFDLDEHGNGLIYGKNPDGTDELRVMETVAAPLTSSYNAPIEQSDYLTPGTEAFNAYWHPLRFGWEEHSNSKRWNFEGEKTRAAAAVFNIAGSIDSYPDNWEGLAESTVAPTTGYLQDFTEKLRTYNQNDAAFKNLKNQSKVINKLINETEENHVIYGDTENPQYAVVEDESVLEDIWEDEQGRYDDFNQFLRDNPSYSMSTEEVDAALEGEEISGEDLDQQTLAGA